MSDYDNYGAIDLSHHDTTPGAKSPFAPPAGWSGDESEYLAFLRQRYRQDAGARQHMVVTAWLYEHGAGIEVEIIGPYRDIARSVMIDLSRNRCMPIKVKEKVRRAPELALV